MYEYLDRVVAYILFVGILLKICTYFDHYVCPLNNIIVSSCLECETISAILTTYVFVLASFHQLGKSWEFELTRGMLVLKPML
jgi:hypothetical protein